MSNNEEEIKEKIVLIPVVEQPPSFGTVLSIKANENSFDKIIICIRNKEIVINPETVKMMYELIFNNPKYEIIINEADFKSIVTLPSNLPKFNIIATLSYKVFVNLSLLDYPITLLPRTVGYIDTFLRKAYRQGMSYDLLKMKSHASSLKKISMYDHAGGE